jgi:uncharacterized protein YecE (DUF72 family)
MSGSYFIGTSGYSYSHWKGVFYPEDLSSSKWLSYYCRYFNAVEINATFYRKLRKSTYEKWYEQTPEGFVFVLKGPRTITHYSRLQVQKKDIIDFLEDAASLKEKAACVLWQLPPGMNFDRRTLESFLEMLAQVSPENLLHAFEFRNTSFFSDACVELLRNYNAAFVCAHSKRFPCKFFDTASFAYFRFHGPGNLYNSNYSNEELKEWLKLIKEVLKTRDVFIFFNNDFSGYAVKNAMFIKEGL